MQPTFLRLFVDDDSKATEYIPVSEIDRVKVTKSAASLSAAVDDATRRELTARHVSETTVTITIKNASSPMVLTGHEAERALDVLDSLSPAK